MATRILTAALVLALLAGCATAPTAPEADARPQVQFVDLKTFDDQLATSMKALDRVEISFFDRVVPSSMPERLQKWMAAVESGGGKVSVVTPPSTVTAKGAFVIVSAVTSLWSGYKMSRELMERQQFAAAGRYNAEVQLKSDPGGNLVIDRIVFVQRPL